jgi:Zn finger protein HypA/HybF involved in hydrogenase expression
MSKRKRVSSCSSSSSKSYSSKLIFHEVTSKLTKQDNEEQFAKSNSTITKDMVLVGCPRCYMYVISSDVEPKCPKCKTTVFLDLFVEED